MSRVKSEREEKLLEQLMARFEEKGIVVWGVNASGKPVKVLVTADGKLVVELG